MPRRKEEEVTVVTITLLVRHKAGADVVRIVDNLLDAGSVQDLVTEAVDDEYGQGSECEIPCIYFPTNPPSARSSVRGRRRRDRRCDMARFVWITFDTEARAVPVEAADLDEAKEKVVDYLVGERDPEAETEEQAREAARELYGERGEECGWEVWPLADSDL